MIQTVTALAGAPDIIASRPRRALVVEDDRRLAYLLRRSLCEEGFQVDIAHTGRDAIESVARTAYDLVVVDQSPARFDGIELCGHLRARGLDAPLLMITPREAVDDRVACIRAGANDYIAKPFSMHEFLAHANTLIRHSSGAQGTGATRQVGDLVLDTGACTITCAGRTTSLTDTETALLGYFMGQSGKVLTRRQIIDHVWNYDLEDASNMVDGCVRSLRDKLEACAPRPAIRAVLSAGYTLDL